MARSFADPIFGLLGIAVVLPVFGVAIKQLENIEDLSKEKKKKGGR